MNLKNTLVMAALDAIERTFGTGRQDRGGVDVPLMPLISCVRLNEAYQP